MILEQLVVYMEKMNLSFYLAQHYNLFKMYYRPEYKCWNYETSQRKQKNIIITLEYARIS